MKSGTGEKSRQEVDKNPKTKETNTRKKLERDEQGNQCVYGVDQWQNQGQVRNESRCDHQEAGDTVAGTEAISGVSLQNKTGSTVCTDERGVTGSCTCR